MQLPQSRVHLLSLAPRDQIAPLNPVDRYTDNVKPTLLAGLLLVAFQVLADDSVADKTTFAEREEEFPELVDEDESFAPLEQVYAFNPVQAKNELKVGNYYTKKGSFRAALGRYIEATRWDANSAEAFWKLALTYQKLDQSAEAIKTYRNFLDLESSGKRARQARQRLSKLEKGVEKLPLAAQDAVAPESP